MITVQKLRAVRAVQIAEYFTDIEAQRGTGDYYAGKDGVPVECPGQWLGGLARRFGLTGDVTREQLLRLLDGCHPITGERLIRWRKDRVAAHDITFSAPKSVSTVWALGSDQLREEVNRAQEDAVAETMRYLEQHIPLIRRGGNGVIVETAAELLAVAFTHHTSRQTAKQADHELPPDPQLHTHVLLPFARRHDGEIAAINSAALFRGRREAEAVYHTALADRLAAMGFEIQRGTGKKKRYFEIAGIPEALCADFSNRHQEIAEHSGAQVAEFRAKYERDPTMIELRDLAIRSRIPKGRSYRDPATYWRALGAAHGVTAASIDDLRRAGGRPSREAREAQLMTELLGEDGLTREHAAIDRGALITNALHQAVGLVGVNDTSCALTKLRERGELIHLPDDTWTTREMLAIQQEVRAWLARRRSLPAPPVATNEQIWAAVRNQKQKHGLTHSLEQLGAFGLMQDDAFTPVIGEAGSGKTLPLATQAELCRIQGRRTIVVAVNGKTAQDTGAELGADVLAMPFDALLARAEHGRLAIRADDFIAIEEAGMVSTRQWARFARLVGDAAQVVAVGDDKQISSLAASGMWPELAAGGGRLTGNRRSKVVWEREAWQFLRHGATAAALRAYAEHGHLTMSATRSDAVDAAVRQWDADGRTGLIVTDASNAERRRANGVAQQRRIAAHELGDIAETISTEHGSIALHAGDRVIFRRQWRIGGNVRRVENGTTGEVVAVDPVQRLITVRTDEPQPRELQVPATEADPLIDLNYASHVYKAQGATAGKSYIIVGGWQTHRESLYVAASRSRHGTHLFLDRESLGRTTDAEALTAMALRGAQSRAKTPAVEPHSPARCRHTARAVRKRHRRVLTSRRPLIETYQRRQRLRWARYEARCRRAEIAYAERWADAPRSPEHAIEQVAMEKGVPSWVVRTYQHVTGMSYARR